MTRSRPAHAGAVRKTRVAASLRPATARTAGVLLRHAVPLAGIFVLGWSAAQFLLLSVFSVCFDIACIGIIGVSVSTAQQDGTPVGFAATVAALLRLVATAAFVAALLSVLFGWVIAVVVGATAFDATLAWSALALIVAALPGLYGAYRADLRSGLDDAQRRRRDQPRIQVLLACGGMLAILSGYAAKAGRFGIVGMAIAVTALFVLRDLRPDLITGPTRGDA